MSNDNVSRTIIFLSFTFLFSCSLIQERLSIKKCDIHFSGISIHKITKKFIDLTIKLKIKNETDINIKVDKIDLDAFYEEEFLAKVTIDPQIIPARKTKKVEFDIHITFKDAGHFLQVYFKQKRKVLFKFVGIAYIETSLGIIEYKLNLEKRSGE